MAPKQPAPAIPAASVLLVRDAEAGLEVLLLERHPDTRFAGGATVFPGGKVDPGDADAPPNAEGAGLSDAERALRVAAIRELFEECAILLAREPGAEALLAGPRVRALGETSRQALEAGTLTLPELARREGLELAFDQLIPFAHWITPEPLPRRFDTRFFLAALPPGQQALPGASESVDLLWTTPAAALEAARAGHRSLMFPTRMNLARLGHSPDVAHALEAARAQPVVTVLPRVERRPEGPVVRIPEEAGYDLCEAPLDEVLAGRR